MKDEKRTQKLSSLRSQKRSMEASQSSGLSSQRHMDFSFQKNGVRRKLTKCSQYVCFCQKKYTTYSGIYLHIKSKHSFIFGKIKKLKLPQLFKKAKTEEGELILLFQNPVLQEQSSRIEEEVKREMENSSPIFIDSQQKNLHPEGKQPQLAPAPMRQMQIPSQYLSKFEITKMDSLLFQTSSHTIKKILEVFLCQNAFNKDYKYLKSVLYDLMVFIDKNCEVTGDPRIPNTCFLSYSSDFGLEFTQNLFLAFFQNEKRMPLSPIQASRLKYLSQLIYDFISPSFYFPQSNLLESKTENFKGGARAEINKPS